MLSRFLVFLFFLFVRMITVSRSRKNEKILIAEGAKQYGHAVTKLIVFVHILFYLSCYFEGFNHPVDFSSSAVQLGIFLYVFSWSVLCLVWHYLGRFWTVKIYVHPKHDVVQNWFFKTFRHPNYFLNLGPEMLAVGLVSGVRYSWLVLIPYCLLMAKRIQEEERAINHFLANTTKSKNV